MSESAAQVREAIEFKENLIRTRTTKSKFSQTIAQTLSTARNEKPLNLAESFITLSKNDRKIVRMIFHQHLDGHIMIGLNKNNQPTKCWSDIKAIIPIKNTTIKTEKFKQIIQRENVKELYVNDGTAIAPLIGYTIWAYTRQLTEQLKFIATETKISKTPLPTIEEIRELDPTITLADYKRTYLCVPNKKIVPTKHKNR